MTAVPGGAALSEAGEATAGEEAPSVFVWVLDTNAVLDWLLFRDRKFAPLAEAIEGDEVEIVTSPRCVEELRHVLRYPEFHLDEARQAEVLGHYLARAHLVEVPEPQSGSGTPPLPVCSDPADQKFVAVADAV